MYLLEIVILKYIFIQSSIKSCFEPFFFLSHCVCSFCSSGSVVHRIVSLTNALRGQLVNSFTKTLLPNILIFLLKKCEFLQFFFSVKILAYFNYQR